jgi:hypothetical protein
MPAQLRLARSLAALAGTAPRGGRRRGPPSAALSRLMDIFGGLIQGLITTLVNFPGTLTSWWASIFVGVLLFIFIVAQRTIMGSFIGRRAA